MRNFFFSETDKTDYSEGIPFKGQTFLEVYAPITDDFIIIHNGNLLEQLDQESGRDFVENTGCCVSHESVHCGIVNILKTDLDNFLYMQNGKFVSMKLSRKDLHVISSVIDDYSIFGYSQEVNHEGISVRKFLEYVKQFE